MRCDEVMEMMQRELDADLSADELREMNEHLHTCTECQSLYANLKQLSQDLENLPDVDPPTSIVDQILPQLASERVEPVGSIRNLKSNTQKAAHWKTWSLIAGGLAAAVCVWVLTEKSFAPEMNRSDIAMQSENEQPIAAKSPELPRQEIAPKQFNDGSKEADAIEDSSSMTMVGKNTPEQPLKASKPSEHSLALVPKVEPKLAPETVPETMSGKTEEPVKSKVESREKVESGNEEVLAHEPQIDQLPSIASAGELSDSAAPSIASVPEEEGMMSQTMMASIPEETEQEDMEQRFVSPSGKWSAHVEGNAIVVLDGDGLEVFRTHSWEAGLEVNMNWTGDNSLEYHLESQGDKTKSGVEPEIWIINLEEGQEQKR